MLKFYAYIFRDPRDNLPFYIGKGSGGRAYRLSGRGKPILDRIKEIEDAGFRHYVQVIDMPSEYEAFKFESFMISMVGRINAGTGPLMNRGEGFPAKSSGQTDGGKEAISRAQRENKRRLNKEFTPAQLERISMGVKRTMTPERLAQLRAAGLKGSQRSAELGLNKGGAANSGSFGRRAAPSRDAINGDH